MRTRLTLFIPGLVTIAVPLASPAAGNGSDPVARRHLT